MSRVKTAAQIAASQRNLVIARKKRQRVGVKRTGNIVKSHDWGAKVASVFSNGKVAKPTAPYKETRKKGNKVTLNKHKYEMPGR